MLGLLGVVAAASCNGRLSQRTDRIWKASYQLPAGARTVRVEVGMGALTFRSGEPGVVTIRGSTRHAADTAEGLAALDALGVELRVVPSAPDVLLLRAPELPEGLDPIAHRLITKGVVRVPPGVAVQGSTGFGAMAAFDLRGRVELQTGHGDVRLEGCRGDVVVRTGGGAVIADKHRGGLDAESGRCQTMQVFIDELGSSGLRLVVHQGGIQAHLPADAAFDLDAKTAMGKARNGFGVPVEPIPGTEHGVTMRGKVAGGGPPVHVEALEEGNVSVSKRGS